jgi:outer membrane protein assembly factor BamA
MFNFLATKRCGRSAPVVCLSIVFSIFVPGLCAQQPGARAPSGSGKLVEIHASGSKQFTPEQVAAASGLRLGEMVHREDLQAAADRLSMLGYFSSVRYRFGSKGEDVTIELQLEDAPLAPASFDNFPWFSDEELAQSLRDAGFLFNGSVPEQGSVPDAMAQTLQKLLETRRVHGVVEHILLGRPDSDEKIQQFRVEGPALNVGSLEFSDSLASQDPHIQDRLSDVVGKPYSRYAIELFAYEQVRPIYLQHSFLRVQFGKPGVRFAGDPTKLLPDTVQVVLPVERGPAYRLGKISWTGNRILAGADLDKIVELHAGDPADGMKLLAAWDRVRASYAQHGFLDVQVAPQASFDDKAATVSYSVALAEGAQYHMGDLILTGLSLEGERRIRAAWPLAKGAVFDKESYDEFVDKGAKLAFGDLPFHYEEIGRFLRADPRTATVDVLLDFH